ncbi:MAG: tripartite tricarboxylate transporter TctB family protein [Beijerinckiaceae bacterium]
MISRTSAEVAFALLTGGFGAVVAWGATEFGVGWSPSGPQPGTFPFYIGCLVTLASLANIGLALRKTSPAAVPFITVEQGRAILRFVLPMIGFVLLALWLGLYVATAIYMLGVMRFQGGYPLWHAGLVAAGLPVGLFMLLEKGFRVSLLKGPLEAALGF